MDAIGGGGGTPRHRLRLQMQQWLPEQRIFQQHLHPRPQDCVGGAHRHIDSFQAIADY
jgi:hypothetical protein